MGGWNENINVIDKLELETKSINQMRHRKCLWKEVEAVLEEDGEFIFPLSDGDWPQPGIGDRALKMKERRELRKAAKKEKLEEAKRAQEAADALDAAKIKEAETDLCTTTADFWTSSGGCITRHHVNPRRKLYLPNQEDFPFPLK